MAGVFVRLYAALKGCSPVLRQTRASAPFKKTAEAGDS